MIQFVLIIPNKEKTIQVLKQLKSEQLAIDLFAHSEDSSTGKRVKITGITRAILYPKIEKYLSSLPESNQQILYSLPIVNMDWNNAQLVLANTKMTIDG